MSEQGALLIEVHADGLAVVTLNHPETGNSLTIDEIGELGRCIRELGGREDVKVVQLRGAGDHFCLGRKPGDRLPPRPKTALEIRSGVTDPILEVYDRIRSTPVPVMAVVGGEARGFGCALVGACDLGLATEAARFSLPEMDHNLPPTLAISALIGKVPPKQIARLVYTRLPITAAEALACGLVGEVVPAGGLEAAAARTTARLTDRSRAAICAVKEYMNVAPHVDPAAAARLAANLLAAVLSSAS
jgi:enoyl-CoA hydratase/carnithine racemase